MSITALARRVERLAGGDCIHCGGVPLLRIVEVDAAGREQIARGDAACLICGREPLTRRYERED